MSGGKGRYYGATATACALRQVEQGSPMPDVCRQLGVSEAAFLVKKRYAHLAVSHLRRQR